MSRHPAFRARNTTGECRNPACGKKHSRRQSGSVMACCSNECSNALARLGPQPRKGPRCAVCEGMSWRRPENGECSCGEWYAPEEPVPVQATIASSMGMVLSKSGNTDAPFYDWRKAKVLGKNTSWNAGRDASRARGRAAAAKARRGG
jgi:hypothetical protein